MQFPPVIPMAEVRAVIDGEQFGDTLHPARVTFLGSGAGTTTAKVYVAENEQWVEADTVHEGTVTQRGSDFVLEGLSEMLMNEGAMSAAAAAVRYEITPRGCQDCQ